MIHSRLQSQQRRIERRLDRTDLSGCSKPMFTASNIHYEFSSKIHGIVYGGIGTFHHLARKLGLIDRIDQQLHLLQVHLPYHESDHVLNIAYNALCDGTCLQDLELRRQDANFLDALGARRIPDPTTAGDFCRRFTETSIVTLMDVIDETRWQAWKDQPDDFFEQARIDMDGTLVGTDGQCKQGMDIAYDGTWGYHPLVVSLANTSEVLRIVNRSGNRPSHEGAAAQVDEVLAVCFRGGFRRALLRGDTDFSQTTHLDHWADDPRVQFVFGLDANPKVKGLAEDLPADAWQPLIRPARYEVKTQPRQKPANVKEQVVIDRDFENLRLLGEEVAELTYRPVACQRSYRLVIVRKHIAHQRGQALLFEEPRPFFYLTNDWDSTPAEIVFTANDRCDQENLLAQLHGGCRALKAPVDNLESNWAYMVMTALAWNLKAWWSLSLPELSGRWHERHRAEKQWLLGLEFKTFVNAFVRLPCQIVRTGGRLVYRLLSWNPYQRIFWRVVTALQC